jgi:hypothetical protein
VRFLLRSIAADKTTTKKTGTASKENNMTPKKTIQVRDLKPMKDAKGGGAAINHGSANAYASHGAASHGAASHGAANVKNGHRSTHGIN